MQCLPELQVQPVSLLKTWKCQKRVLCKTPTLQLAQLRIIFRTGDRHAVFTLEPSVHSRQTGRATLAQIWPLAYVFVHFNLTVHTFKIPTVMSVLQRKRMTYRCIPGDTHTYNRLHVLYTFRCFGTVQSSKGSLRCRKDNALWILGGHLLQFEEKHIEQKLPVKPLGHRQVNVVTGQIGLNSTVSLLIKWEAFPNFNMVKHSSQLRQGSLTHRLSSNGSTCKTIFCFVQNKHQLVFFSIIVTLFNKSQTKLQQKKNENLAILNKKQLQMKRRKGTEFLGLE